MLITPETAHGVVFRKTDTMYTYQGWPSVCRTDDGKLIAAYSGCRMRHICPFGKTVLNVSYDDGESWSPQIVVNDTPLDDRDAGIVSLGGGRLLLTWFVHPAEVMENRYINTIKNTCSPDEALVALAQIASYRSLSAEQRKGGSYLRLSEDGGVTWGETVRVPVSAPHGPGTLPDGSLLYLGKEHYSCGELEEHAIAAYRSPDCVNWEKLAVLALPEDCTKANFHEPHVLALPGGRLLGLIRAQSPPVYHNFTMYSTTSDDGGRSWTVPRPLGISGSPPHLLLHSSGAVVCCFGRREAPFGERAIVSHDGGESWTDEYVLDDRADNGDLGYPASVELPDGSIFTLYYQRFPGDEKPSILYTKWRLAGR